MLNPHSRFSAGRIRPVIRLLSVVVAILFWDLGLAHASEDADAMDPSQVSQTKMASPSRARGQTTIDLPRGVRARFESTYTNELYLSDKLARDFLADIGPDLRMDRSLESRFSLTRSISDRIEIGIVWGARSRLTTVNLFDFERQTIGAIIQLVPW